MGDPRSERVDIPVAAIEPRDVAGDPGFGQKLRRPSQLQIDALEKPGMRFAQRLSVVGNLADFPQQAHRIAMDGAGRDLVIASQTRKRQMIDGGGCAHQHGVTGGSLQARQKPAQ